MILSGKTGDAVDHDLDRIADRVSDPEQKNSPLIDERRVEPTARSHRHRESRRGALIRNNDHSPNDPLRGVGPSTRSLECERRLTGLSSGCERGGRGNEGDRRGDQAKRSRWKVQEQHPLHDSDRGREPVASRRPDE